MEEQRRANISRDRSSDRWFSHRHFSRSHYRLRGKWSSCHVFVSAALTDASSATGTPDKRCRKWAQNAGALVEGLRFLGRTQVMLAAITLDLFAVLLGGATTLLPIYATSILHVGPIGLGWLDAADSIGAVCMALVLAHRPPFTKAGPTLLLAVTGFGVATIIFGCIALVLALLPHALFTRRIR